MKTAPRAPFFIAVRLCGARRVGHGCLAFNIRWGRVASTGGVWHLLVPQTSLAMKANSIAAEAMPDADPLQIRRQALRIAICAVANDDRMARFEMPDTFGPAR